MQRFVDVVILGDGYRDDQIHKLRDDARRFVDLFFDTEPFAGRRSDFNVRLIETVSRESGIDNPRDGVFRDNQAVLDELRTRNAAGRVSISTILYGARPKEAEILMRPVAKEHQGRYRFVPHE